MGECFRLLPDLRTDAGADYHPMQERARITKIPNLVPPPTFEMFMPPPPGTPEMEDCADGGGRNAAALGPDGRSAPPAAAAVVVASSSRLLLDGRFAAARVLTEAEGSVRIDGTRCRPPKPPNDLRGADSITWDRSNMRPHAAGEHNFNETHTGEACM